MTNTVLLAVWLCWSTESSCGRDVRISDGGRAVGEYQIWPVAVREANRLAGRRIWWDRDRWDAQKSRAICQFTLSHHYRRGVTNVIDLAARWRNPNGSAPEWHREKLRRHMRARR